MLKRLVGILFTLAALATFVWVGLGRYTSWCFGAGEVPTEKVLPAPADTVSPDNVSEHPAATPAVTPVTTSADGASADDASADGASVDGVPAAPADTLPSSAANSAR